MSWGRVTGRRVSLSLMTPVEAMGQAVASVAAGLRKDRDALSILLRMTPDEAVAVAGGMLDLVNLLAKIVAEREGGTAAEMIEATAAGRSDVIQRMAAFAIEVINSGGELPTSVDAAEVIVGLGAIAGRLTEVAAEQEGGTPLDVLARIGLGVAQMEAFEPPE
ncbi:hypothetical protein Afe04nite_68000 [Asanoa ferruginea]|nr:hypothetical protein Afe04nite_68000 [Asanoa ferruginea]